MIRYFCDWCGQENTGERYRLERIRPGSEYAELVGDHLHKQCFEALKQRELAAGNRVQWCTDRRGYYSEAPDFDVYDDGIEGRRDWKAYPFDPAACWG